MSDKHFNQLTPAEAERLAILAEECGEVIQIVGKVLRHGYSSFNPDNRRLGDNRHQLEVELGDLRLIIHRMGWVGDLSLQRIQRHMMKKSQEDCDYTHHQGGIRNESK